MPGCVCALELVGVSRTRHQPVHDEVKPYLRARSSSAYAMRNRASLEGKGKAHPNDQTTSQVCAQLGHTAHTSHATSLVHLCYASYVQVSRRVRKSYMLEVERVSNISVDSLEAPPPAVSTASPPNEQRPTPKRTLTRMASSSVENWQVAYRSRFGPTGA